MRRSLVALLAFGSVAVATWTALDAPPEPDRPTLPPQAREVEAPAESGTVATPSRTAPELPIAPSGPSGRWSDPYRTLEGRVVDRRGAPIVGARIEGNRLQQAQYSLADGSFAIRVRSTETTVRVSVRHSDHPQAAVEAPSGNEAWVVVLDDFRRLIVSVADEKGEALADAMVTVALDAEIERIPPSCARTDIYGVAALDVPASLPARLHASSGELGLVEGHAGHRLPAALPDERSTAVRLVLVPIESWLVVSRLSDGAAPVRMAASLQWSVGGRNGEAWGYGSSGTLHRFQGVPVGVTTLRASFSHPWIGQQEIALAPDPETGRAPREAVRIVLERRPYASLHLLPREVPRSQDEPAPARTIRVCTWRDWPHGGDLDFARAQVVDTFETAGGRHATADAICADGGFQVPFALPPPPALDPAPGAPLPTEPLRRPYFIEAQEEGREPARTSILWVGRGDVLGPFVLKVAPLEGEERVDGAGSSEGG